MEATVQSLPPQMRVLETETPVKSAGDEPAGAPPGDRVRIRALDEARSHVREMLTGRQALIIVLLAAVASVFTLVSGPVTTHVRFAFFDCAVVVAAIYAGLPGGLFNMLIGILVVGYEWLPPKGSLRLGDPAAVFAIIGFTVGGLIVTVLAARFRQQARELRLARDAALAAEERQRLVDEAGRVLSSSLDYETTVASIAQLAVPRFADGCAVDLLVGNRIERLAVAHADPEKQRLLHEIEVRVRPALIDDAGISMVIRTGEPQLVPVVTDAMLETVARSPEHLEQLHKLGVHSAMIVPMSTRGMTLGALSLLSASADRPFTHTDFSTAQALARRAAISIDNARLYRAARSASEVKSNFIATMSHELRTPLTAIIGFQELLADGVTGPVTEKQKQPLSRIKASALRLLALIEEILLFARLDAGGEVMHVSTFSAKHVVDDVIAFASSSAEEHKLSIRADQIDPHLDVQSDFGKLRQILVTLTSNAIHFTPSGEVVLRARASDDSIVFEVQDTGIGMDAADVEHIFEPFWQVDQTKTRKSGGSGLGLSLARRLVQLLGGEITVESQPQVGSTFRVLLPRSAPRMS